MVGWAWMITGAALPLHHLLSCPTLGQAISVTTRTSRTESSEHDNSVSNSLLSFMPVYIIPDFSVSPEVSKFAVIKRYNPLYFIVSTAVLAANS